MSQNMQIRDFTSGNITKQLIQFALPLFLSNLLQVVYNMVDMVIVGQTLGEIGLSAVSLGGDVANIMTFVAMGYSTAGQVLISQFIGEKRLDRIGKFVGTMSMFMLICAVTIGGGCLIFRHQILQAMNTPAEAYGEALAYSTVCMCGLVFIYGYNVVSAVLRGMGDSRHPFLFISIAAVLNLGLDILLVIVFEMGAAGAALATVVSQGVSFLLCLRLLIRRRKEFALDVSPKEFCSIDKNYLIDLVALGTPRAITMGSVQFTKLFVHSWVNSYGVTISAFSGISGKINSVSNLLATTLSTAGASMVGQNIGGKQFHRVKTIMLRVAAVTLSVATVFTVLMLLFPKTIYSAFTSDAEVIAIGLQYVPICIIAFYGAAIRAPMSSLMSGSGNYKINLIETVIDSFVMRLGLSFLFGLGLKMGYMGFWLGDAMAGYTPLLIGSLFYMSGKWKDGRKKRS